MQIEPRRLLALQAVARHGSVLAAAHVLHMTPSAVSQNLATLERECGIALIDRSRRGGQRPISFTAAGQRLIEHGDRLAAVLDDVRAEVDALTTSVSGPVVVSTFFTALRGFVASAVLDLAASHPAVEPRIRDVDEREVTAEVMAGHVDVGVVEDDASRRRPVPQGLCYEALADDPFRLLVPVGWPETDRLDEIADRPWIDGPPGTALGYTMQRIRRVTGLPFPAVHSCREFTAALALVGAGAAGAFLPELAIAASPPSAQVRVSTPPGLGARRIGLLYRRGRHEPTPATRTVLDALRAAAPATDRRSPADASVP